jgi:hypothetical protein
LLQGVWNDLLGLDDRVNRPGFTGDSIS